MLALLLSLAVARAACPADAARVRGRAELAEAAYVNWDWPTFESAVDEMRAEVACLSEILPGADAARVHLVSGLAAGRAGDVALATASFRGHLAVHPGIQPSEDLVAPGSLLAQSFEDARRAGEGEVRRFKGGGPWFVDGSAGAADVVIDRASVVQRTQGSGVETWYLDGRAVPQGLAPHLREPDPGVKADPGVEADPSQRDWRTVDVSLPERRTRSMGRDGSQDDGGRLQRQVPSSWWLAGGGVITVVTGGVLLGRASALQAEFMDTPERTAAEALASKNHAFTLAGAGLMLGGSGLVTGAVLLGRW